MFSELLSAVSDKLNISGFELLNSKRTYRIIRHYAEWLDRPNRSFQFAVERAIHDIYGRNGPDSPRKESRL